MHIPVVCYFIILEFGPVTPSVPGAKPSLGAVISLLVLGSGILDSGTGMVTVVVGVVVTVVGAVVVCDPEGWVSGFILLQAQAHRESANARQKIKMPSFFMVILLSVLISTVVFPSACDLDRKCIPQL